jgi:hypothetical protein
MNQVETQINSIDAAINECDKQIAEYTKNIQILLVLFAVSILLALIMLFPILQTTKLSEHISEKMVIVFMSIFVVILGLIIALYRFLIIEISRIQGYKLGFMRIRIAANNHEEKFGTDVRRALTDRCFEGSRVNKKDQKIESPIPGHPTSDLSALLINKLFENIELVSKDKIKKDTV